MTTTPWQVFLDSTLPQIQPGDPDAGLVIQQAIDMVPGPGFNVISRPTLRIPYVYVPSDPELSGIYTLPPAGLKLEKPLRLLGEDCALSTQVGGRGVLVERSAGPSAIEDLNIVCSVPGAQHDGIGLEWRAPNMHIRNVNVSWTRVFANGIVGLGPPGSGCNVNQSDVRFLRIFAPPAGHFGFLIQGGDANAGVFDHLVVTGGELGVSDQSFIGNEFRSLVLEGFSVCGLRVGGAAAEEPHPKSTYVHPHIEGAGIHIDAPGGHFCTWVGGPSTAHAALGDRIGQGWSRLGFRDEYGEGANKIGIIVALPDAPNHTVLGASRLDANGAAHDGFRLRYRQQPGWPNLTGFFLNDTVHAPFGWVSDPDDTGNTARVNAPGPLPDYAHLDGYKVPRPPCDE